MAYITKKCDECEQPISDDCLEVNRFDGKEILCDNCAKKRGFLM